MATIVGQADDRDGRQEREGVLWYPLPEEDGGEHDPEEFPVTSLAYPDV